MLNARELALRVLRRVEEGGYASAALDEALSRRPLSPPDRRLVTELVYGVTRRRNQIDHVIEQVSSRPVKQMDPWVRNILRLATYQLLHLDRIPAPAAVHTAVEMARSYGRGGSAGFVNAVLRSLLRQEREPNGAPEFALRCGHPELMVERWRGRYGDAATLQMCAYHNSQPPLTVRVNRLRADRAAVQEVLAAEGVRSHPLRYADDGLELETADRPVAELRAFKDGLITVQDQSSMLVAPVVNPRPGDFVIDACAAPGGKATHLAEWMQGTGRVLAVDVNPSRLSLVKASVRRLGLRNVRFALHDSRHLGALFAGRADAVLADVPCSGLGTLGRRPDARWRKTPETIEQLLPLQSAILASAASCVKPGGVLVYATCTTEPEENLDQVRSFLNERPDFRLEPLWPFLPVELWSDPGVDEGWLQLLPHRHGTDGFFMARLRRRDRAQGEEVPNR